MQHNLVTPPPRRNLNGSLRRRDASQVVARRASVVSRLHYVFCLLHGLVVARYAVAVAVALVTPPLICGQFQQYVSAGANVTP